MSVSFLCRCVSFERKTRLGYVHYAPVSGSVEVLLFRWSFNVMFLIEVALRRDRFAYCMLHHFHPHMRTQRFLTRFRHCSNTRSRSSGSRVELNSRPSLLPTMNGLPAEAGITHSDEPDTIRSYFTSTVSSTLWFSAALNALFTSCVL